MKTGWKTKTLEDVCQFSNGLWKGEKPPFVNVGVIRNTNFTKEGTLDDSDIAYLDVEAKKLEKRRLQFGDIILEKSGGGPKQPVGRVALFDIEDGDFSFSNFTAALRVLNPGELDFRFLHKFLYSTYLSGVTEGMQSHSTGIRNLDGDAYKAIRIAFPPLSEQQRIVSILDAAFEGIASAKTKTEKNLQNARALFGSQLEKIFSHPGKGWTICPLADCLDLITYGFTNPMPTTASGPYMVTAKNVVGGRIDYASTRHTSREAFENLLTDKSRPSVGDVLLTKDGTLGRLAVVDKKDICINQSVALLRPNGHMEAHFMRYLLSSRSYQNRMVGDADGATIKHIYITRVDKMEVAFPQSPMEQENIVSALVALTKETERLATAYEHKLAALEALKKSLLHQAFTGNL
jgi:type I restriction enzyme, S subunit